MAKSTESKTVMNRAQALAAKAAKVSAFTAVWEGVSLADLLEEGQESQKMHFDECIDAEIVVYGFSIRTGEKGEFAVIAFSPDDGQTICSTTNGSAIVIRKLKAIAEKNGFPVRGMFVKPEGKRYHDFTDATV